MYRLEKLEELLFLPSNVEKCAIDYQKLLQYVYENKKKPKHNLEVLHEILIKKIKKGYEKNIIVKDVILTRKELDRLYRMLKHM